MRPIDRRKLLKVTGAGLGTTAIAGCLGDDDAGDGDTDADTDADADADTDADTDDGELDELHTIEPEGAITVPWYLYAQEHGIFEDHGIDLSFEVAPFGKYVRQVVDGLSPAGGISIYYGIEFMHEGHDDLVSIGHQLHFINQILTRADSDIDSIDDLSDATFGHPGEGSFGTQQARAFVLDEYGFDYLEDPASVQSSPPPALYSLLLEGDIDACFQFSGLTVRGNADDEVEPLWGAYDSWMEETGAPPVTADIVVEREWLENNPDLARRYLDAVDASYELFRDEVSQAITQYGALGGIQEEAEAEVIQEWVEDGLIYEPRPYDEEMVDATYQQLELVEQYHEIPGGLPPRDELFVTESELEEMM